MPQHHHAPARICTDCHGFATVAIATGTRHHDGSRQTIAVHCPTCTGTGHTARTRALTGAKAV